MTTEQQQPRLVPDYPPELGPVLDIPLTMITGYHFAQPDIALQRSIAEFGVLNPVLVREVDQPNGYRLLAGRRRCKSAEIAGHTHVPGIVVTGADDAVLALVENANRSANPMLELEAIERLIAQGATESEIARATGMSVGTIRERLKLRNLHPILASAAASGDIAIGVARAAAKLPIDQQDDLVAVYHDEGKLTGGQVHEKKSVGAAQVGDTLFAALGVDALPTATEQAPAPHWTTVLLARLDGLLDGLSEAPLGVTYHLGLLRSEVEANAAVAGMMPEPAIGPEPAKRRRAPKEATE